MGDCHAGVFLLVIVVAVVSVRSDLCPFPGDWRYHNSTGTCMRLNTTKTKYLDAIRICQHFKGGSDRNTSGDLVFIFDKNTDDFVKELIKNNSRVGQALIGLNNRVFMSEYRWSETRQKLGSYTGWAPGNPTFEGKYSVVISADGWKNIPLKDMEEFVCQVKAVMPLPTISGPPAEVGEMSSITCSINVTTDQATVTELRFNRSDQVVASCTRQGCNKENDRLNASLTLDDDSWTSTLQISTVQRNDEGNWSCSVKFSNGQETTSNQLDLNVYSVPSKVECEASYLEDTMTVSCTTEPMYPEAVCKWDSISGPPSQEPRTHQSNSSMHYDNNDNNGVDFYRTVCSESISRPVAGEYQFQVSAYPSVPGLDGNQPSTIRNGSLRVVLMPPMNPPVWRVSESETPITHLEVTVNQTITIKCEITGVDPAVYSITTKCFPQLQNETSGHISSVNINTTQEFHGQNCSCSGKHVTGSTNVTYLTFLVKSSPRIISFNINRKQGDRDVEENDQINMTCNATGYPEYTLSLVQDQEGLNPMNMTSSTANSSEVTYNINATCPSGRRYTCLARNKDDQTDRRQIHLKVRCAPTYCPNTVPKYGIPIGSNIKITMCVDAYPAPTKYTLFKDNATETNEVNMCNYTANFSYTDEVTDRGVITVTINNVREDDFGVYVLCSGVQQENYTDLLSKLWFELLPRGPPNCPENLTVSSTFSDSITLSWTPGYDGGLQQSFTILRYDSGLTTESQNVSVIRQPERNVKLAMSYNVTGLTESTTYTFGVWTENMEGVANCTVYVQGSTNASSSHGDWKNTVVMVTTVLGLFLVIILVVVVIIVLFRKRRSRVITAQVATKDHDVSKGDKDELNKENTFPIVNKQNKKKEKKKKSSQNEKNSEAAMYSNLSNYIEMKPVQDAAVGASVYANAASSSKTGNKKLAPVRDDGRTVTEDGLIYAEVMINVNTTNPEIKGQVRSKVAKPVEPGVEYVSIDFAATASLK